MRCLLCRAAIVAGLALVLACAAAPRAVAGQQTRIWHGANTVDYYEFTPATTGNLTLSLSWTNPDGTGAPWWPVAMVDLLVQGYDSVSGEEYRELPLTWLMMEGQPLSRSMDVTQAQVGHTLFVGVPAWVGDVPYRLQATFPDSGTSVIDTGPIDVGDPGQVWAQGTSGSVYVPSAGRWHSVLQEWPGSLDRGGGTSDVWANWDDYAFGRDDFSGTPSANWTGLEYYPPVVTDATIMTSGGGSATPRPGRWYVVAPQAWTAAARPNVWTDILGDAYPKPSNLPALGAGAAPAWYTYSFPDDAKQQAVAYFWANVANASASRRAYSGDASTAARFSASFYGPTVTWVYRTGPYGGRADVLIDGSVHNAEPIELYSPSVQWRQTYVVSGLTEAAHTIEVRNHLSRNPSSGSYFVYHDAFVGKSDAADPLGVMENDTDGSTIYQWPRVSSASASGGSFSASPSTAAAAAFSFTDTAVSLIYRTGPYGGRADVYIDGVFQETVEMFSAADVWQLTKTWSGLPYGLHTIFIKNNGARNPASLSNYVYLDAFRVGVVTYEN